MSWEQSERREGGRKRERKGAEGRGRQEKREEGRREETREEFSSYNSVLHRDAKANCSVKKTQGEESWHFLFYDSSEQPEGVAVTNQETHFKTNVHFTLKVTNKS